jgi:hypothetical protein
MDMAEGGVFSFHAFVGPVKMTIDDNLTRGARLSRLFSPTSSAHPRCKAADEP